MKVLKTVQQTETVVLSLEFSLLETIVLKQRLEHLKSRSKQVEGSINRTTVPTDAYNEFLNFISKFELDDKNLLEEAHNSLFNNEEKPSNNVSQEDIFDENKSNYASAKPKEAHNVKSYGKIPLTN